MYTWPAPIEDQAPAALRPELPRHKKVVAVLPAYNAEKTLERTLADHHPGGGYWVFRIKRTARDLGSSPEHARQAQGEAPTIDVLPGLDVLRALRVDYVITSSYGATPERLPELGGFFEELYRTAAFC